MNSLRKGRNTMLVYIAIGAVAGYALYYFVGCSTGGCPLTSNPWTATGYGALLGWLLSSSL
jgi:hypothetical protein